MYTLKINGFRKLKLNIIHGKESEHSTGRLSANDMLYIYMFSIPKQVPNDDRDMLHHDDVKLNGETVKLTGGQGDSYGISDKWIRDNNFTGIKSDDGKLLAVRDRNSLWILFDLLHEQGSVDLVSKFILNNAFGSVAVEHIDISEAFGRFYGQYISDELGRLRSRKSDAERNLQGKEAEIQRVYQDFARVTRDIDGAEGELKKLEDGQSDMLQRILNIPEIDHARVTPNKLIVVTNPINLGGFDIGPYKIILTRGSGITMNAVNYRSDWDKHHPHVTSGGSVCWGTLRDVSKYYASGEWDTVMVCAIKLLMSYNGSDSYMKIERWFERVNPEYRRQLNGIFQDKNHNWVKRVDPVKGLITGRK
jgi:hypothetical protein